MSENLLCLSNCPLPCESQPHKGHLASKLKYRRFPSYLLSTLLLFPFHLLPSPVHPTGFSFWFFPGFLAMFTLMSSNNNNLRKEWNISTSSKIRLLLWRLARQCGNCKYKMIQGNVRGLTLFIQMSLRKRWRISTSSKLVLQATIQGNVRGLTLFIQMSMRKRWRISTFSKMVLQATIQGNVRGLCLSICLCEKDENFLLSARRCSVSYGVNSQRISRKINLKVWGCWVALQITRSW